MVAFCYLKHWGTLLGQYRNPAPSAGRLGVVQKASALPRHVLICTEEILSNIPDLCFLNTTSWSHPQPASFPPPMGKWGFWPSWKVLPGEMVLAPCPRNTRIVHILIQVSYLLSHSSEAGLKNVRESVGPSGCGQGRAGPPLSAAEGCYIGSAACWIVPLHDKVGRAETVLCILGIVN